MERILVHVSGQAWRFYRLVITKSDPITGWYFMTFGILNSKIYKIIAITITFFHASLHIILVVHLVVTFDSKLLVQYVPKFCIINKTIAETVITLSVTDKLHSLYRELQTMGNIEKFKHELQLLFRAEVVNLIIAVVAGFIHLYKSKEAPSTYYGIMLFRNFVSNETLSAYLCNFHFATWPFLAYSGTTMIFIYAYLMKFKEIQFRILCKNMEKLSPESEHADENVLIYNEDYQRTVWNSVKGYVQHHSQLKSCVVKFNAWSFMPLLGSAFFGFIFIMSMLFDFINRSDTYNFSDYMLTITNLSAATMNLSLALHVGQQVTNASVDTYTKAFDCAWTSWNSSNRKMFLIFLSNLQEPVRLGCSEILPLQYSYYIKLFNLMMSACMFFQGVSKKRN